MATVAANGKELFSRLCHLLIDAGTEVMRLELDRIIPPKDMPIKLQSSKRKLAGLHRTVFTSQMEQTLYPTPFTYGRSKELDMSLLMVIFINVCNLSPPSSTMNWKDKPSATDTSLSADLVNLKLYRNVLFAHTRTCCITLNNFRLHWNEISAIIERRGKSLGSGWKDRRNDILTNPLSGNEERYIEELKRLYLEDRVLKEMLIDLENKIERNDRRSKGTTVFKNVIIIVEDHAEPSESAASYCMGCMYPFMRLVCLPLDIVVPLVKWAFHKINAFVQRAEPKCIKVSVEVMTKEDYDLLVSCVEDHIVHRLISAAFQEYEEDLKILYGVNLAVPPEHLTIYIEDNCRKELPKGSPEKVFQINMVALAPDMNLTVTWGNEFYYRICQLLMDVGTKMVRNEFDRLIRPSLLDDALMVGKSKLQRLTPRVVTPEMWTTLYPTDNSYGKSTDFDLTLLLVLFQHISPLQPPLVDPVSSKRSWDEHPLESDQSIQADIKRLELFRDKIVRATKPMMSEAEYTTTWNEIANILIKRGGPSVESDIDKLRTMPLTDLEITQEVKVLSKKKDGTRSTVQSVSDKSKLFVPKREQHLESIPDDVKFKWRSVVLVLKHEFSTGFTAVTCGICLFLPVEGLAGLLVHSRRLFLRAMSKLFAKYDSFFADMEKDCIKIDLKNLQVEQLEGLLLKIENHQLHREISAAIEEENFEVLCGEKVEHLSISLQTMEGELIDDSNYQDIFSSEQSTLQKLSVKKQKKKEREEKDMPISYSPQDPRSLHWTTRQKRLRSSSLETMKGMPFSVIVGRQNRFSAENYNMTMEF